jgi:lysophospholipid acyltransferase (LPLAT)-like uncharacterized protein
MPLVDLQDQPDPFNQLRPEVHRLTGARLLCARLLGTILRLYLGSLRLRTDPATREALAASSSPRVIVVWHNRSLVIPQVFKRFLDPRRIHCLVSPSRLAAWEVDFFAQFHLRCIRGSSSRRSVQAAVEMRRALRRGEDIGISPDGPSGPLYSLKPGALAIARKAGVPLLLLIPNARTAVRARTWDRHLIPLPFSVVEVKARHIPASTLATLDETNAAHTLRALCLELTEDPFHAPPP